MIQTISRAIILRRTAFGDADWIVTFFSRDGGRMSGFAKSARKSQRRFGGALEPGTLVDLSCLSGRGDLVRLDESRAIRPILDVMKSLEKIEAMSRALELALVFLQEHQSAPDKFDLLDRRLQEIAGKEPGVCDSVAFELEWLKLCGFGPHISSCIACEGGFERPVGWSFDLDQGGILCGPCSKGIGRRFSLTASASSHLMRICDNKDHGDEAGAQELVAVITAYIEHIIGRPLRTGMDLGTVFPHPASHNL